MRGSKSVLAALIGLVAVAACGSPQPSRGGAPIGPGQVAPRYRVLNGVSVCTPTPTTGTCNAAAGRGGELIFSVVDKAFPDLANITISRPDVVYSTQSATVEYSRNGLDEPVLRITANLDGFYTGLPVEPTPTFDPIFVTIDVNFTTGNYAIDGEGFENDAQGSLVNQILREGSCDLIPVSELFPG